MRQLEPKELTLMQTVLVAKQFNNSNKKKLETAIYARKSSEDKTATSIETQITDCKSLISNYPNLLNLQDCHIYKDEAKSGMFTDNRDGLTKMMKEVKNGNIDVIVLYHHERLTRNIGDFDNIKKELEQYKVFLIFGNVYYENSNMGEFYSNLCFAMAQFEARTAATKTAQTLHLRAQSGKSAGGRAPYGLKCIGKQFDIEPNEAPAIKLLFDLAVKKTPYQEIITTLTANGYLTRSGEPFKQSTISDMLRNWKYAGIYVYCRKDKNGNPVNRKKRRVLLGEQAEVRNDNTVLRAIVSKKLFLEVQDLLDEREIGRNKQNAHPEYLLSGIIECECGKKVFGETTKSKRGKKEYRYYVCSDSRRKNGCKVKKINAEHLENTVKRVIHREVNAFLKAGKLSGNSLTNLLSKHKDQLNQLNRRAQDLERENKRLSKKYSLATEDLAQALQKTITDNVSIIKVLNGKQKSLNNYINYLNGLGNGDPIIRDTQLFNDITITRKLIRAFIKTIIVKDDKIEIQLHN